MPTPRQHPDELSYGSSGVGSVFHLMGELFNQTAGVKIKHVPYRGVAPAMQDVIGGHIPMVFISVANAEAAAKAGQVKILAVLEPARYSEAAGCAVDERDHPGVPQTLVVVRIFRAGRTALADRHAPQRRDGQGARANRGGEEFRGQRLRADRRNAAAIRRPA